MANHPISLISPIQIVQTSIANNSARNAPATPGLPSSGAATSAANVSTAGNAAATDVHLMQSSDATTFVYGSTKSNELAAGNNYTTVDDAGKLATRVASDNDVIDEIKREDQGKKKQKRPGEKKSKKDSKSEEFFQEPADDGYHLKNTMMVASHGIV
ncbi:MAG: hypothetical protein DVB29_05800 [Verrucomicrobia bacterium]|jgi:hypothetical protein|nr:MAG: hypothetical protein DVB29_05800 [Verrucomicrobiota bacterium]MDH4469744.1 hypothetical protein [Verrucomicrobiae bacterium]